MLLSSRQTPAVDVACTKLAKRCTNCHELNDLTTGTEVKLDVPLN